MPKIIVTTDTADEQPTVLLEESVYVVHLSTGHSTRQLIERLDWAVRDAEELDRVRAAAR